MAERRTRRGIASAASIACAISVSAGAALGATGDLSGGDCISGDSATGNAGTSACTQAPLPTTGGADSGLDGIQSVDVSNSGSSIYATAQGDDAIVHLERNASTGEITFSECITGGTSGGPVVGGGTGACEASPTAAAGASDTGFDDLIDAAISPGGTSVYAISQNDDAVVQFDRDLGTGGLTFVDCYSGEEASTTTGGGQCEDIPSETVNGTDSGLDSPSGITISPNGKSVYVTSANDDSIAGFSRALIDGALTYGGCITGEAESGSTGTAACADFPTTTVGGAGTGLDQTFIPVVSADGESVYVGSNGDAAITWFDRNTGNGVLSPNDCITGETGTGPSGTGACGTAVPTANALGTGSGMDRIQAIAISPDGSSVYAGSQTDSAVNDFARNATTGDLTLIECLTGSQSVGSAGCTEIPSATTNGEGSGLKFTQSLAISPDGKSLYAAAAGDDAIASFDRQIANGDLAWDSCVTGETASGPSGSGACAAPGATLDGAASGLDLIRSVAVTPDGLELIGGAENDDAIASAARSNAPETSIDSEPPAVTNDPTATFTFSTDEAVADFHCRVDSAAFAACSGNGTHTTASLTDGAHTFEVRAVNDADEPDPTPASSSIVVDTVPPDTSFTSGPAGGVASGDVSFEFAASNGGAAIQCSLDGEAFAGCTSPRAYTALADGSHTFEVRSIDAAGNIDPTPAERSFSVDTVKPNTTLDRQPAKTERSNKDKTKLRFRFSSTESGSEFECKRDKGKAWKACKSPYVKKYKRGEHTFKVRSIDAVGNVDGSAATRTWKVKRKN